MERKIITFEDIIRRNTIKSHDAYYAWIRHVVTLASGTLTVLVALKSNYVPVDPQHLWLLKLCWVVLALSILSGVLALRGEWQTPLDSANQIQKNRKKHGEHYASQVVTSGSAIPVRKVFSYAAECLVPFYGLSLLLLVLFAVLNL